MFQSNFHDDYTKLRANQKNKRLRSESSDYSVSTDCKSELGPIPRPTSRGERISLQSKYIYPGSVQNQDHSFCFIYLLSFNCAVPWNIHQSLAAIQSQDFSLWHAHQDTLHDFLHRITLCISLELFPHLLHELIEEYLFYHCIMSHSSWFHTFSQF